MRFQRGIEPYFDLRLTAVHGDFPSGVRLPLQPFLQRMAIIDASRLKYLERSKFETSSTNFSFDRNDLKQKLRVPSPNFTSAH